MSDSSLTIIGSGLAAYTVAKTWRQHDPTSPLTIITLDDGCFYSKPMLSSAFTKQQQPDDLIQKTAEQLQQELEATLITHTCVTQIIPGKQQLQLKDPQGHLRTLDYQRLVLACGAQPKIFPSLANSLVVNNLMDYRHFRAQLKPKQRIAVVGAGLVGSEFINDLSHKDYELYWIAPEALPLSRLIPTQMAAQFLEQVKQQGVACYFKSCVEHIQSTTDIKQLTLSCGTTLKVDHVLSATGLAPHVDLAQKAGLAVDQGIVVNNRLETSQLNIWAVGDCAQIEGELHMYVAPILRSARCLAQILAGQDTPVVLPPQAVAIKTPLYPMVVLPPSAKTKGHWTITFPEGPTLPHCQACFYDEEGQLRGFALSGKCTRQRMTLSQQIISSAR